MVRWRGRTFAPWVTVPIVGSRLRVPLAESTGFVLLVFLLGVVVGIVLS